LRRFGPLTPIARPTIHSLTPTKISTTTKAPKIALYGGLNKAGLFANLNDQQVAPPDSTGAIGPNHYVEMVNSVIGVWDRNLSVVSESQLYAWVGDPLTAVPGYCDPQIQWDPTAGRWLYLFIVCNAASGNEDIHFGWSKTSDPSNLASGWCHFYAPTGTDIMDFPKLGHNSKYMIVGANDFTDTTSTPTFQGSLIFWMLKPLNGVTSCTPPTVHGSPFLTNGDTFTPTFTPVPVNTMTGATNGYVVSAYDPTLAPQTNLAIWHVDSNGILHQDPDIHVASFTFPGPAPQDGSTAAALDTLDGRLTQAVGDPTSGIWTQHTVDGPGGRSVVQWYEIKVLGGVPSLTQQGNIGSATEFVFNGAVSPRFDAGGAAVIYNRSGPSTPTIAAQIRFSATPPGQMEAGELVLGLSPQIDTDFTCNSPTAGDPCRWGDYSGASPDPIVQDVVWGTNELNSAGGSTPAWEDRNFALAFVTKPLAPTAVTATAGRGSATVSWTPSTYVPTPPTASYTITAYVGLTPTFTLVVAAPATSANFGGLTDGVAYTFTVFATNSVGSSAESVHSNAVTPGRQAAQAPPPAASTGRPPVPQSSPVPAPTR